MSRLRGSRNVSRPQPEVVQRGTGPEARAALERLADAIVSLEYYMETIQAGRREPDWMLENAGRSLDALLLPEIQRQPAAKICPPHRL